MILEEKRVGEGIEPAVQKQKELLVDTPSQSTPLQHDSTSSNMKSHAHHSGILRRMLGRAVANRFTSRPIDMEKNRLAMQEQEKHHEYHEQLAQLELLADEESKMCNSIRAVASDREDPATAVADAKSDGADNQEHQHHHYPTLTPSEQKYLETLLESEDPELIRQATLILSDHSLFPHEDSQSKAGSNNNNKVADEEAVEITRLSRRDSKVQRLLFRMHEVGRSPGVAPATANNNNNDDEAKVNGGISIASTTKRRLGWNSRKDSIILQSQTSMSSLLVPGRDMENNVPGANAEFPAVPVDRSGSSTTSQNMTSWLDPAADDGEIQGTAKLAAESIFKTSFAILGTAAGDASCHPHVLSPPLMESLLEFVPETLSDYHFYLKYSLVRDGNSLYTLLRQTRASARTILAIETTDGQVFGAFTSRPWRLVQNLIAIEATKTEGAKTDAAGAVEEKDGQPVPSGDNSKAFYGSNDTFLWKMRQSRFDSQALLRTATVEEAILLESEMAVYPFTGSNNCVQHCSADDGIGLGENASAIRLDPSLRTGSTAASETFGNPCLLGPKEERVTFKVANLEVWTLTPHDTVKEAEKEELTTFFQRCEDENSIRLNLFGILVGGPKVKR